MKKLSIVIPAYNCMDTISKCLDSIINQSGFEKCEVIIVNDGSIDETKDKIEPYLQNNVILINQKNGGVSNARNMGLLKASGEYLMFVDSDDLLIDMSLSKILDDLEHIDDDLIVYGLIQEFYKKNKLIKKIEKKNTNEIINIEKDGNKILDLIENSLINGPYAKIFKMKIVKEHNIKFNEKLKIQEDLAFNINYLSYCKNMILKEECIYRYLINSNSSITSKYLPERIDNFVFVENKLINFFETKCENIDLERLYFISVKDVWSSLINTYFPGNNFNNKSRKNEIKNIISKSNYELIKKSNRNGLKYLLLKKVLIKKNVFIIDIFTRLMFFMKKKLYINYK